MITLPLPNTSLITWRIFSEFFLLLFIKSEKGVFLTLLKNALELLYPSLIIGILFLITHSLLPFSRCFLLKVPQAESSRKL